MAGFEIGLKNEFRHLVECQGSVLVRYCSSKSVLARYWSSSKIETRLCFTPQHIAGFGETMSQVFTPQSLRPKDAAAFLGIGVSTLWRWQNERADMPKARRLSERCSVFDRDELTAWRNAQPRSQ